MKKCFKNKGTEPLNLYLIIMAFWVCDDLNLKLTHLKMVKYACYLKQDAIIRVIFGGFIGNPKLDWD